MIKYNKYLKEIGVKPNDFPFEIVDSRYIEDKETHISSAETWEMDKVLDMIIYSYLRAFEEEGFKCVTPGMMERKKWEKIFYNMLEGFKLSIIENYPSKRKTRKIIRARKLFVQYYGCLWW